MSAAGAIDFGLNVRGRSVRIIAERAASAYDDRPTMCATAFSAKQCDPKEKSGAPDLARAPQHLAREKTLRGKPQNFTPANPRRYGLSRFCRLGNISRGASSRPGHLFGRRTTAPVVLHVDRPTFGFSPASLQPPQAPTCGVETGKRRVSAGRRRRKYGRARQESG